SSPQGFPPWRTRRRNWADRGRQSSSGAWTSPNPSCREGRRTAPREFQMRRHPQRAPAPNPSGSDARHVPRGWRFGRWMSSRRTWKSGYYYASGRLDVSPASSSEVELYDLVLGITEGFEVALHALRLSRLANAAAVPDELVREQNPLFSRNRLH